MGIETVAAVSIGSSIAGGILGAFGSEKKADAEAQADMYKAQVARNNAIIAERKAGQTREAGGIEAENNDLKTKSKIAEATVVQAANGLDVNTGTNVDVRNSMADLGRLDTLTIISNAAKKAQDFEVQAMNFNAEGQLDTMAAENAKEAGDINAASSLISGAGSVADKWLGFSQKGIV